MNRRVTFSYPTDLHYSQTRPSRYFTVIGLVTLQIYTTLKHGIAIGVIDIGLVTLQIYTTLKHNNLDYCVIESLVTLQIYTTLKRTSVCTTVC